MEDSIKKMNEKMNILLINVPSRKGKGGFELPLGLLYVGSILERNGHTVKIYDPYLEDVELNHIDSGDFTSLHRLIEEWKPSIIGYGGIATSYTRAKKISTHIKSKYPDIFQIAGGALSTTYELLLSKGIVDVVFHGETETSLPDFLNRFSNNKPYDSLSGISLLKNGSVVRNPAVTQIDNLDVIPLPAYQLIDLKQYTHSINNWIDNYKINTKDPENTIIFKNIGNRTNYIPIATSRGCTHKCLFCYRHVQGIRRHSVGYVINHIKFLIEKYGIYGFQFCEELFNSDIKWVNEFVDAIERENLSIFYLIAGARVDKINRDILKRLADTGCIEVNYGHESGSDTILKEYRKGVTAATNSEVTLMTIQEGMSCPIQLVIGSPSETTRTIKETAKFLQKTKATVCSLNYLIPLPETPIWQYVEQNALIPDVEKYLEDVSIIGGLAFINLTKQPDKVWKKWPNYINRAMHLNKLKKKTGKKYWMYYLVYFFKSMVPECAKNIIPESVKKISRPGI